MLFYPPSGTFFPSPPRLREADQHHCPSVIQESGHTCPKVVSFLIRLCTIPCSGAVYLGVLSMLVPQPTRLMGYSCLSGILWVYSVIMEIMFVLAATYSTLNRLVRWILHYKEWNRLMFGAVIVVRRLQNRYLYENIQIYSV